MTFEEFLDDSQVGYSTIETKDDLEDVIKRTWDAAIESAATKLARGTNLYNICGDHISGQVLDSITQLKSS